MNSMQHSTADQRPGEGENLYAKSVKGSFLQEAAQDWVNEKANYQGQTIGTGDLGSYGHYTQVVWPTTTKFGMGQATGSNGWTYVVARYSPQGNYMGQSATGGQNPNSVSATSRFKEPSKNEEKITGLNPIGGPPAVAGNSGADVPVVGADKPFVHSGKSASEKPGTLTEAAQAPKPNTGSDDKSKTKSDAKPEAKDSSLGKDDIEGLKKTDPGAYAS
jgi:hypothetical protein